MKILITGSTGLASALSTAYKEHTVQCVSLSLGYNIHQIDSWGKNFLDQDMVFNCAYSDSAQVKVLEFFFNHWKNLPDKQIISIGSKIINQPASDGNNEYRPYRLHKQTLQLAHDTMIASAKCDMKIINPGPIDTPMVAHLNVVKFDPLVLAKKIKEFAQDRSIKRIDLWV